MNAIKVKGVTNANITTNVDNLIYSFLSGRKASTIAAYQQDLFEFSRFLKVEETKHAAEILLTLSLGEANALALNYRIYLIESLKLQSATVNRRLASLRSLTRLARTIGLINWSLEIKNQEHRSYRDVRGISTNELKKMFDALQNSNEIKSIRDLAILRLLYDLGLRRDEVCSINVEDIDFENSSVWIQGKGHNQKELLQLPELTKKAIESWIQFRGVSNGPLFFRLDKASDLDKKRLTGTGLYSIIKELGERVGIKNLTVHKLRHTAITSCCEVIKENNLGLESVLKFSRHKSLNTALIYFDHLENQQSKLSELVSKKIK